MGKTLVQTLRSKQDRTQTALVSEELQPFLESHGQDCLFMSLRSPRQAITSKQDSKYFGSLFLTSIYTKGCYESVFLYRCEVAFLFWGNMSNKLLFNKCVLKDDSFLFLSRAS